MGRDEVVGRNTHISKPCWIVRAYANGDAEVVVCYGWVLQQIVYVSEILAGQRARLYADIPLQDSRNQVRMLEKIQPMADTRTSELHNFADIVIVDLPCLSSTEYTSDLSLSVLEFVLDLPDDGSVSLEIF